MAATFQLTRPHGTGKFALCRNAQNALCRTCDGTGGGGSEEPDGDAYWTIDGKQWRHMGFMDEPADNGYFYDLLFDDKKSDIWGYEINNEVYWGEYDAEANEETAIMMKWLYDEIEDEWTMIWGGVYRRSGGGSGTYSLYVASSESVESPPATLQRFIYGWHDVAHYRFHYKLGGTWFKMDYHSATEYQWETELKSTIGIGQEFAAWDLYWANFEGVSWTPSALIDLPEPPLEGFSIPCELLLYYYKTDSPQNDWWGFRPDDETYRYRQYSFNDPNHPNYPAIHVRYKVTSISRETLIISINDPTNFYPPGTPP